MACQFTSGLRKRASLTIHRRPIDRALAAKATPRRVQCRRMVEIGGRFFDGVVRLENGVRDEDQLHIGVERARCSGRLANRLER